jgi:hypothetical protein
MRTHAECAPPSLLLGPATLPHRLHPPTPPDRPPAHPPSPYGVAGLLATYDDDGPALYLVEPSGIAHKYYGTAVSGRCGEGRGARGPGGTGSATQPQPSMCISLPPPVTADHAPFRSPIRKLTPPGRQGAAGRQERAGEDQAGAADVQGGRGGGGKDVSGGRGRWDAGGWFACSTGGVLQGRGALCRSWGS